MIPDKAPFERALEEFEKKLLALYQPDIELLRKTVGNTHLQLSLLPDRSGVTAQFRQGNRSLVIHVDSDEKMLYTWKAYENRKQCMQGSGDFCPFVLLEAWIEGGVKGEISW